MPPYLPFEITVGNGSGEPTFAEAIVNREATSIPAIRRGGGRLSVVSGEGLSCLSPRARLFPVPDYAMARRRISALTRRVRLRCGIAERNLRAVSDFTGRLPNALAVAMTC